MRLPRPLPDRPNLDQLRHQARDLLRAAARDDPDAVQRLLRVARPPTLHAAQLALAREYGFASWTSLRVEVERRRALADATPARGAPMDAGAAQRFVVRPASSQVELAATFDVIGGQATPRLTHDDRRFADLARRFAEDQALMLLVEDASVRARIVGGALAFRTGPGAATLRILGLEPRARGSGVGRRLLATLELEAARLGVRQINLVADPAARGFYAHLGYAGRGVMMRKGLPLPGRFLDARLRKLRNGAIATPPTPAQPEAPLGAAPTA